MTTTNVYFTLAEYKSDQRISSTDTGDDAVIERLLTAASRFVDGYCSRPFYPRIETKLYDIPSEANQNDTRMLILGDDLLGVITFLNGDASAIASTEYKQLPANFMPRFALRLKNTTTIGWESDTDGGNEQVLAVTAWWGYHNEFTQRAWIAGGTLAAAITTPTATTFTMTAGHTLTSGQIVKIDNEIMNISVSTNTVTPLMRGDNGSTAAAHVISSVVYYWDTMADIKTACSQIAASAYKRRFGENLSSTTIATAAGVQITPQDVPAFAREILNAYRRLV